MNEQEKNEIVAIEKDEKSGSLEVIFDAIGAYLGDVPSAIKRNVGKAFGHLIKVPNAWIDGTAAEIKANSDARIAITKATGKSIVKKIDIDISVASIAADTAASKILRQTVNTAKILQNAAENIKDDLPGKDEIVGDIAEDWLNAFEQEAVNMSSEQMQKLFGKILAGEIRRPATYSIRTIKLISQLDNKPAELFRILCSLAITARIGSYIHDCRVIDVSRKSTSNNGLKEYGLSFDNLNILFEYGLIIGEYDSYMPYYPSIVDGTQIQLPFVYANQTYGLKPIKEMSPEQKNDFRVEGVKLSRAGTELIGIVDIEENHKYTEELKKYFDEKGFEVIPVTIK